MSAKFEEAWLASFVTASAAIENGEEWPTLLILDLKDFVLGAEIPLVEGSLVPAIRALRSSMPHAHPLEAALLMDVWLGASGDDVRPREDPASQSALMVVRQRIEGVGMLSREYWVGDGGEVTWAEELVTEPGGGGAVVDELADWVTSPGGSRFGITKDERA